eukprot:4109138-Amphidinium_carterae.1
MVLQDDANAAEAAVGCRWSAGMLKPSDKERDARTHARTHAHAHSHAHARAHPNPHPIGI